MEKYITTLGSVNFRMGPSTSYPVLGYLGSGAVLRVLEYIDGTTWCKARLESSGTVGYITTLPRYVQDFVPSHIALSAQIEKYVIDSKFLGQNYDFGSSRTTTTTFDCSDFVKHIYGQFGIGLGWTSRDQAVQGVAVPSLSNDDLRAGDLIFFARSDGYVYHVAMYVGDDLLLHTYSETSTTLNRDLVKTGDINGVTYSSFKVGTYWRNAADFARRVIQSNI